MRKIEVIVKVYPAGVDKDGNYTNPVSVVLAEYNEGDDLAAQQAVSFRENYVRQEYKFCRKEEDALLSAIYRKDRIRCKNDLMLKRAEFARNQGYFGADNQWTQRGAIKVEEILV